MTKDEKDFDLKVTCQIAELLLEAVIEAILLDVNKKEFLSICESMYKMCPYTKAQIIECQENE